MYLKKECDEISCASFEKIYKNNPLPEGMPNPVM